ncbi:Alpha-L-iduronidase [Portunus trituberculatus]|uniref:Alpha-L-iduronidase n=1 Tax=Portunus trituberculatus TaxID=210409 RepID=A0A5B7KH26_PORTR|nr:Alpha-L-iduronidase [Portunus trituberculatus]
MYPPPSLSPPLPHSSLQPFLLSPDELLNLAVVGSLPHEAISQVRIHWLFGLVNAT